MAAKKKAAKKKAVKRIRVRKPAVPQQHTGGAVDWQQTASTLRTRLDEATDKVAASERQSNLHEGERDDLLDVLVREREYHLLRASEIERTLDGYGVSGPSKS